MKSKRKRITGIIPVRRGSQRVPGKNIKPFAGSTLLDIKIEQLKQLGNLLEEIVVTSDCDIMLEIAEKKHGVRTHKRDSFYASSQATNSQFFANLASVPESPYVMYAPVTCPIIYQDTYERMIEDFQYYDNLVTVAPVKHHMWLDGKPLNYEPTSAPNSQDLPEIRRITYGVSLVSRGDLFRYRNVVTPRPTFFEVSELESIDIDTPLDFDVAEFLYERSTVSY